MFFEVERFVYTIFYLFGMTVYFPLEILKRDKVFRKRIIKEKLGLFRKRDFAELSEKRLWIHSVSVGETLAVVPLVRELTKEVSFVLSTVTDTGQKVAMERFKGLPVKTIFCPIDCPFAIGRTLRAMNPRGVLLTETEIWPNLICESAKKAKVALINGRLSERSFLKYQKVKFFISRVLNKLEFLGVQEEIYAERFFELGVPRERIYITGNVKFDINIPKREFPWEKSLVKPVIIAGSTHHPEEREILKVFFEVFKEGTLILAPRHPQRFKEVENLIREFQKEKDFEFKRLSEFKGIGDIKVNKKIMVILVDQIGILGSLYRISELAIIGGSFITHGGQNPLEPIFWGKPVVCGPSMENFPFITEFLEKGALFQVKNAEELKGLLKEFLKNRTFFEESGKRAQEILEKKRGATSKTLKLIKNYILS